MPTLIYRLTAHQTVYVACTDHKPGLSAVRLGHRAQKDGSLAAEDNTDDVALSCAGWRQPNVAVVRLEETTTFQGLSHAFEIRLGIVGGVRVCRILEGAAPFLVNTADCFGDSWRSTLDS